MTATELLAQVRGQQPEALEDEKMLAFHIVVDGLLQDVVGRLMAIVCTLRLDRMRDTVGHVVSSSRGGRKEARERRSRQTRSLSEEEEVKA